MNLDRLSVLIVEDNAFVGRLLSRTIRAMGIRQVEIVDNGKTGVEKFELIKKDPVKARMQCVDIVLCDMYMPTVDGNLFLRWLRTSKQSPDRFMPVIMISGAADPANVRQVRDGGATEFLAKPFSAKTVSDRIVRVIDRTRPFILNRDFFGPDRRRAQRQVEKERRVIDESEIEEIHGNSSAKTLRDEAKVMRFVLPNRLREKVGAYGPDAVIAIDPAIIEQAEEQIQSMAGDYANWVEESILRLVDLQTTLALGEGDAKDILGEINTIAHELRGQGGIFGYPLVTHCGKSLYEATVGNNYEMAENRLTLLGAHVDAIRTVFRNKIAGDGGEIGIALLEGLEAAVKKYTKLEESANADAA